MAENPIYKFLKSNNLTTKDEASFVKEYSNESKAQELYGFMKENKLTEKDFGSFYGDYFSKKALSSDGGNTSSRLGIGSNPFQDSQKPIAPTVLTPQKQEEYVQAQQKERKVLSDQLGRATDAFIAVQGDDLSNEVQSIQSDETLVREPLKQPSFTESVSNTGSNIITGLESFIPNTAIAIGGGLETILGKDVGSDFYAQITQGGNPDIHRMQAYEKLAELEPQYKQTRGLVEAGEQFDVAGLVAGAIDAVGSLVRTAVTSVPTAGLGLYTDMIGSSVADFNKTKAKSLGISVNELYERGENEYVVPATIGAIGAKMETIGLKGAQKAMLGKLSGTMAKKIAMVAGDVNKEGMTEWLQTGLEASNKALGEGKGALYAGEKAVEEMFSKKGLESYLMGVVGSGGAASLGRLSQSVTSPKSKVNVQDKVDNLNRLNAEILNPEATPESKEFIESQIRSTVSDIVSEVDKDIEATEKLGAEQKQEVETLNNQIAKTETVINDPTISPETKNIAEEQSLELNQQLEDLLKEKPKKTELDKQIDVVNEEAYEAPIEVTEEVIEPTEISETIIEETNGTNEIASAEVVDVGEQAGNGERVGEGNTQEEVATETISEEVPISEKEKVAITHQTETVKEKLGLSDADADVVATIFQSGVLTPDEKNILFTQYKNGVMSANDVRKYAVINSEDIQSGDIDKWTQVILDKKSGNKNKIESEDIDFEEIPELKPTKLESAKQRLTEKREALKKLNINTGIASDPKQKAKALFEYHSALVDVAKEYISEGITDVKEFAKGIGEKVTKVVQDAWDEAIGGNKLSEKDFENVEEEKEVSGIKKALVSDDIIAGVNLDNISDKEMQALGEKLIESGEAKPKEITLEIAKGEPRALQPKEVVALIHYKTTLDNQRRELLVERNKLAEKGESTSVIDGKLSALQDDIDLFDVTAVITAQQQSLAFRLRKGLLDKDYNLVTQIEQYKKVNNGVIPPEVEEKFREYDRQLAELKEQIAEAEKKLIEEREKKSIGNIVEDVERSNKTRKSVLSPKEQARKNELAKKYRVFNDVTRIVTILAEKDFREYAKLVLKEAKGDFQVFATEILKTLGVDSKKFLPKLYEEIGGKGEVNLETIIESPTVVDGKLNIPANYIRDLVNDGVTDINKLSEKVFAEVQKELPDVTLRQVRDAITGYGRTVNQTADEIQRQVNEAKRLGRLYSQLEDIEQGKKKAKLLKQYFNIGEDEGELKRKIKSIEDSLPKTDAEIETNHNKRRELKKTYFRKFIKDREERLRNKNFAPRQKPSKVADDAELTELETKANEIRDKYDEAHYENEQKNRTYWEKIYDNAIEWYSGLQRALQAGLDFSALGVQGIIQLLSTNPKHTLKAIKEGFRFMSSEKYEKEFFARLKTDPLYPTMKKSGLALQYPNSKMGSKDYQLTGGAINKIWNGLTYPLKLVNPKLYERAKLFNPYRATERAYTGIIDTIRVQLFKQFAKDLEQQGITPESDPQQYKIAANATNNLTFRGRLRFAEPIAKELAVLYFAPRKITATLSLTNPAYWASLWLTSPTVAKRATLKMATFLTLSTTITLATKAFREDDDEDENPDVFNPLSADFMKLRLGNTRLNFFGSMDQNVILFARMLTNKYKSSGSSKTSTLGENKYVPTRWDLLMRFNTNKFAPTTSMSYRKLSEGEGRMFDWDSELQNAAIPIWTQGINELQQEHPTEMATFLTILNFFGQNMSTYGNAEFLDKNKDEKIIDLLDKKNASFFEKVRANISVLDPDTGEEREVTKDEFTKYKKTYGDYIKNDLKSNFSRYFKMSVEEFEKQMSRVKGKATELAKESVSGVTPELFEIGINDVTYKLTPKQAKERKSLNEDFISEESDRIRDKIENDPDNEGKSKAEVDQLVDKKIRSEANSYSKKIILEENEKEDGTYNLNIKD